LLAYKYYIKLFEKIEQVPVEKMKEARIRVPDLQKILLLVQTLFQQRVLTTLSTVD